jgi:hypothetical protein
MTAVAASPRLSTPPTGPRRRRPWLVALAAALALAGVLGTSFMIWRPASKVDLTEAPAPSAAPASPDQMSTSLTEFPAQVTQPRLVSFADALSPASTDGQTGPVQYVKHEYWGRDMDEMAPFLRESWLRADFSGVTKVWKLPNRPPNFDPAQIGHTDFRAVEPGIDQAEAKDIMEFGKPFPGNAQALFDQLSVVDRDGHLSVADVLGIYRVANEWQIPSLGTRAAFLRLLAHLPNLTVKPVRDGLDRNGIGVTTHADHSDYTLIFAAGTGELLAYDVMMTDRALGGPTITLPALAEYELFYDRSFTTTAQLTP